MDLIIFNLLKSNLIKNVKDFIQSLTLIDVVFFFSVLLLMILVVVLLYFIKINEDDDTSDAVTETKVEEPSYVSNISVQDSYPEAYNNFVDEKEEQKPVFNGDLTEYYDEYDDEKPELLDLKAITKALENNEVNEYDLSSFEEEQEREAIISYDELINKARNNTLGKNVETNSGVYTATKNNVNQSFDYQPGNYVNTSDIQYKNELMFDDLLVKEVDLDSIIEEQEKTQQINTDAKALSTYAEEEEFLESLKSLQKMIN